MKPVISRGEARSLDSSSVARSGLPTLLLMENAGSAATEAILSLAREESSRRALDRVVVLGGTGQNGGDAWVVARHLVARGFGVSVFMVGSAERVTRDARQMLDALLRIGVSVADFAPEGGIDVAIAQATLIVDGIFGTGLDRPVDARHAEIFGQVNASSALVVSLDIPSGVDADTGEILGAAVHADATVTFGAIKRGLTQEPGASRAGAIRVASLGMPIEVGFGGCELVEESDVRAALLTRLPRADAHKGTRGHVLVIAGSPGMDGAASLASRAAFRAGAGVVSLLTRGDPRDVLPEVMILGRGSLPSLLERAQSVVIGPGLGTDEYAAEILLQALARPGRGARTVVLDADALTLLALREEIKEAVAALGPHAILTPHPGEASRLLGLPNGDAVQRDRFAAASQLAARYGATSLLKGAGSLICYHGGSGGPSLRVVATSAPSLAVAGSGDVLAGAIGALAVAHSPADAATIAVYLHASIGASKPVGLVASEVADAWPLQLETLSR